jgi:cob(I)alamin adenosyltransferase
MPVRITRVYTRSGDKGETGLVGGKRVPKDAARIEAYGTIDELNCVIGLARAFNDERLGDLDLPVPTRQTGGQAEAGTHRFLDGLLREVQNELFDLGAELATPADFRRRARYRVGANEVRRIEATMDRCQKELQPLDSFVLPGGGKIAASLHQCRAVCRRAEREIVRLSRHEAVREWARKYVNRLGDLFFVLARWIAKRLGEKEELWQHGLQGRPKKAQRSKRK